jgi:hypothetical protein
MLIEKAPDLANLILASTFPFSIFLAALGVGAWSVIALVSYIVAGTD